MSGIYMYTCICTSVSRLLNIVLLTAAELLPRGSLFGVYICGLRRQLLHSAGINLHSRLENGAGYKA